MYAKVFTQIFDSSIAENYKVRHVFEDLLKLADKEGNVNMTVEAVARRTNVPLEEVRFGIEQCMLPEEEMSQSKDCEGRRLILLDPARPWGWHIVNYQKYRDLQDGETLRANWRESKKRYREEAAARKAKRAKAKAMTPEAFNQHVDQKIEEHQQGVKADQDAAAAKDKDCPP